MNFAVNHLETNSIVIFAVNYSDGARPQRWRVAPVGEVHGKVLGIVEIGMVLGKVLDGVLLSRERVNLFQDGTVLCVLRRK